MNESKEENQFSEFLDNILRSAEGLEQGRKNDSFSSIELDQISNFFTRIASNYKKTADGCLLLAQQGIDTTSTDKLLNILSKQTEKNESKGNENIKKSEDDFNSVYRFTNAIEKCELDIFESIDQNWESLKKEVNFESLSDSIFSKDSSVRSIQSTDVESFANAMRQILYDGVQYKIFNPIIEILVAWKNYYYGTDNDFYYSNNRIVDYITALQYVMKSNSNLEFGDVDIPEALEKSIESHISIHENVKSYIEHYYRYQRFVFPYKNEDDQEREKKIMNYQDDSDEIVLSLEDLHYQDYRKESEAEKRKTKKWNFIWDLIQSGLLKMISKLQSKSKNHDDTVSALLDLLGGKVPECQLHHDTPAMNKCFTYANSRKESIFEIDDQEIDDPLIIIFYRIINNLKLLESPDNAPNSKLFIKQINTSNSELLRSLDSYDVLIYDKPIYDIALLDFNKFVIDIIELCYEPANTDEPSSEDVKNRLPVIAAHLALMFYNVGYLNNYPNLKVIINDLISILPMPQYADVALAYLSLSRGEEEEEDVIKFLLSLELNCAFFIEKVLNDDPIFYINIYNFGPKKFINIIELVRKYYEKYEYEARTIKILTIFGYYDEALYSLIRKDNGENIDKANIDDVMKHIKLSDVSILLEVSLILIIYYDNRITSKYEEEEEKKKKEEEKEEEKDDDDEFSMTLEEIKKRFDLILKLATRYSIYTLANSDVFNLVERIKNVKSAEKIYTTILKLKAKTDIITYFDAFLPMIQVAKIINAFEARRDDEAVKLAFETKILPFNINEIDDAIKFLDVPGLRESSAISTAIEKSIMHLSKTVMQYDVDTKHLKSIIEFCKYLRLDEDILAKITKIRIKLSLL